MSTTDAHFAGSIPELYDRYLVPLLFEPYAQDMVGRLGDLRQGVVLEIAAGTGAVTQALAAALPEGVRIIATDLNESMLRVAASRVAAPTVTWRQADAQQLPFEAASADVIVCQFGAMFFPNRPGAYAEARRVLKPTGRYLFNVWGSLEHNEVSQLIARSVAGLFPDDPPRFFERTPFGYFDPALIRADLEQAGFRDINVEVVEKVTLVPSAEHAAIGVCQGTPLRGEIEARDPARLAEATAASIAALSARFGSGAFDNRMQALVVTARP